MVNYDSAKATAIRLLRQNGRSIQIIATGTNTGTDYNPVYGPDIITEAKAVFTMFSTNEIDGTIIEKSDKKVLIDSDYLQAAIEAGGPLIAQKIKDGDVEYSIINVDEIKPGPLSIMSKLQCRV